MLVKGGARAKQSLSVSTVNTSNGEGNKDFFAQLS